ncbi:MAG: outer membrane protein assembly factor BamE [Pseudomonadota bacterium]
MRFLLPISIAMMMASCVPIVDTRGHSNESADMSQIVAGQTSADDVAALLGSPTTSSNFGEMTWYYVTQKQERVGVLAPEVTEQHVTAISFDGNKIVKDISEYAKEEGKLVDIVDKTTPTEGHKITFMEQMLGNFGRFNSPGRSIDPRNLGR